MHTRSGISIIEVLIVVAIALLLGAAVYVSIDPELRLHESRNIRRQNDVEIILSALIEHVGDNEGALHSSVEALDMDLRYVIGTCFAALAQDVCVDLSNLGLDYLPTVPFDPETGSPLDSVTT